VKYTYAYKTSDGVRHEDAIEAASRDEAFAALRARGIRPIKVVAADGTKANGEIRGVRKRVAAAVAVAAAIVAGVVFFFVGEQQPRTRNPKQETSSPRHQIYGDPVVMEEFERGAFDSVFSNRVDQMLAWFSQPGRLMCPPGTVPRRMAETFVDAEACRVSKEGGCHSQTRRAAASTIGPDDSREVRELKQIVNGMREEFAEYLSNGVGTPATYWQRLLERYDQECMIYERTRRELESESDSAVWKEKNEALRRLGLRTIPRPKAKH